MSDVVSIPLLKFTSNEQYLVPRALEAIKRLEGPLCPLIFIGDGRSGKSYIGSRLLGGENIFLSNDSPEPVTEGIDMAIVTVDPRRADEGSLAPPAIHATEAVDEEHLLVLDCEGGNNAMAAVRSVIDVFSVILGTTVVFVTNGVASEQALQSLGTALAARSLVRLGDNGKQEQLPEQRLVFLVNKNSLRYEDNTLEKILQQHHEDQRRLELRESICTAFKERQFATIPLLGSPSFEASLADLRSKILRSRRPLALASTEVRGPQLCGLLELMVSQFKVAREVSLPSINRYIIFNGYLVPIMEEIIGEAERSLPRLTDYEPNIERRDPRALAMRRFDNEVSHVMHKAMVEEVRQILTERVETLWADLVHTNAVYGDEVREVRTEMREVEQSKVKELIGVRGLLKRVTVTRAVMAVENRAVVFRKHGGEPEASPWKPTGSTVNRIEESAFEHMADLPELRGRLNKCSPNLVRAAFSIFNGDRQERICILKDGHFLWWEPEAFAAKKESSGCINFFVHRAEVVASNHPTIFTIRPVLPQGWSDLTSFTGGKFRQFHFDTAVRSTEDGVAFSRDDWIAAVEKHINFSDLAAVQLGEDRVRVEVRVHKPWPAQVDG